jgi:hypothetical protein
VAGTANSRSGEHQGDGAVLEEVAAGPKVAKGRLSVVRSSWWKTMPNAAQR